MPRNGSGTYTLPESPFVPSTTISSSAVNNDFSDIATALSGSIAADGQTPITGQLLAAAGLASAPSYSFTSSQDTGVYLRSTSALGLTANSSFGIVITGVASVATAATPSAAGSNYAIGDTITLTGGTYIRPATLAVATLSGSGVATVTISDPGLYYSTPSNPASQGSTSGTGSGATFTVTYGTTGSAIWDLSGGSLWTKLGASTFMAGIMGTLTAAALNASLQGTVITPSNITTNQNDYAPTGFATAATWRLNPTSSVQITGISKTGIIAQQQIKLLNINSTNTITLTANDTNSSAGNRFLIGRPVSLRPSMGVILQYDTTSAGWFVLDVLTSDPPASIFKNLSVKVATNTTVAVAADDVVLVDTLGYYLRSSTVSSTINMATTGANALDAGSIASSTWYAIWVISNGTTTACLASTSGSTPTMPSGYTFKARIGWVRTASGSAQLLGSWQFGNTVQYVVGLAQCSALPNISNGTVGTYSLTTPTLAATSVSNFVPTTAGQIRLVVINTWNNQTQQAVIVAPNTGYSGASSTNPPPISLTNTNGTTAPLTMLLESTNIAIASSGAGGAVSCFGWVDNI